jgi:hypothetical protein
MQMLHPVNLPQSCQKRQATPPGKWFTARHTDLVNPQIAENGCETLQFFKGKNFFMRNKRDTLFRTAIPAAQIAAVGNSQTQVSDISAVIVFKPKIRSVRLRMFHYNSFPNTGGRIVSNQTLSAEDHIIRSRSFGSEFLLLTIIWNIFTLQATNLILLEMKSFAQKTGRNRWARQRYWKRKR